MVRSINTVTIRQFSLFEQTKDGRYLIRWNLPLTRFYAKQIVSLLEDIAKLLGSQADKDAEYRREFHRLKSVLRIQYLITLYQATYNLLINKTEIDIWRSMIGKNTGSDYTGLIDYIGKIEQATGIVIEPDDWSYNMIRVKEEIDRLTDKFNEAFSVNQDDGPKLTFLQIVVGVFSALQMPINEDMRLVTFFELKNQAEELAIKLKLQQDGGQH